MGRRARASLYVDLTTAPYSNGISACERIGGFTDPGFDPKPRAFHCVRVLGIPTPRWTVVDTVNYDVKTGPEVTLERQERAVTSPMRYTPN